VCPLRKYYLFKVSEITKKSLKIPNRQSESATRRTENTMAKRKKIKGQRTIYKTLHGNLPIEQHEPYIKPRANSGAPDVSASLVASVELLNFKTR
jgi:hypothetical protein